MSTGDVAYLSLVVAGFGAFMVALSYGYIRCALADRRESASRPNQEAGSPRKAA